MAVSRTTAEEYDSRTRPEVQANRVWTPPTGPLGRLSTAARERAAALRARERELRSAAASAPPPLRFADALRGDSVAVIAEVKRRSPSKGVINAGISAAEQSAAYVRGGAAALSILTEPAEFGGSSDDLASAASIGVPVLKKDFHVDLVQVLEARALGASALLLIARALRSEELRALSVEATELGLDLLLEVRGEDELEEALQVEGAVIGVNSRNLETLEIDPSVTARLLSQIPGGRLAVAESGLSTRDDVCRVAELGADAVLVGSSLSASSDPAGAVRALTGVRKVPRAG